MACAGVAVVAPGCTKARAERTRLAELQAAGMAIEEYSAASDKANAAHREVLSAFAQANASSNIIEYKAVLRTKALPAMDAFVAKLAAMPTGTPELKQIHGGLTEAYRRSRDAIAEYERTLQDPKGVGRFDAIREQLQRDVRQYSEALSRYYAAHSRQLRQEAAKDSGKDAPKEAASGSAPAAPAKPAAREAAAPLPRPASAADGQPQ